MTDEKIVDSRSMTTTSYLEFTPDIVVAGGYSIATLKATKLIDYTNRAQQDKLTRHKTSAISLTCRQGRAVVTECTIRADLATDTSYEIEVEASDIGQSPLRTYKLPGEFMRDRVCPIISKGSPSVYFDHNLGQYRINNINPTPMTGDEVNSLVVSKDDDEEMFDQITELNLKSQSNKDNTVPQQALKSIASLNLGHFYIYHNGQSVLRGCTYTGFEADMYYQARSWETFACKATSTTQTPQVVIATCGKDGKMYVAPFITEQFPTAVTSFDADKTYKIYKCYAPDPLWVRYKHYANAQGIAESQMTLDASIYPEIKKVNLLVTNCQKNTLTEFPLPDSSVRILFDSQTVTDMISKTANVTALQSLADNIIIKNAKVGDSLDATHFMNNNSLHQISLSGLPDTSSESNISALLTPVLSIIAAVTLIATAVTVACCRFGPKAIINAGRSRLGNCRKKEDVEQGMIGQLTQAIGAGLSWGLHAVPQSEQSASEKDTSCAQQQHEKPPTAIKKAASEKVTKKESRNKNTNSNTESADASYCLIS